jgi:hypothetical protein
MIECWLNNALPQDGYLFKPKKTGEAFKGGFGPSVNLPWVSFSRMCALFGFVCLAVGTIQATGQSTARADVKNSWFGDIAAKSNISYRTNNNFTGRKYFPQPMCGGIAVLDYNNDGKMDLFFTNGAQLPELRKAGPAYYNALLRNRGDGTFEDVTAKAGLSGQTLGYSFGVAVGDYDNDGYEDIFIANAGRNTLYHNNGNGTFTDVTTDSGLDQKPENVLSVGAAWFDFDNDGLLDLIVSNYTTWTPETDKRCGLGDAMAPGRDGNQTEHRESYCSPKVYRSVPPRLYRNLGHGHFQDVTESSGLGKALGKGMGIAVADFNGDGWMDIFIANDTEPNSLFINQGNGTFKEEGLVYGAAYGEGGATVSSMGADAKDFDNDGWVDIVYNDLSGQLFTLLKNRDGQYFDDVSVDTGIARLSRPYSGWSIGFIDYNNDGWKDIYSANGDVDNLTSNSKQHDSMFENQGGTTFSDVSDAMGKDFQTLGYQRGSAFVDLNNDGWVDLVVTSLGEKPRILINNALNGNHWTTLELRGRISNRDAIGAKVKVTTISGRTLYEHVTTSVGFMSSSDKRVHLGLGQEKEIREIEIRWPSGIVQRIEHPEVDKILHIEETGTKPSTASEKAKGASKVGMVTP